MADAKKINVKALDDMAKQVAVVYKNLEALELKLDVSLIKRFGDLAKGVNQFANALRALTEISVSDITQSTSKIQKMFEQIEKLDASLQSSGKLDASPLVKFSNSLYRFTLAMKDAASFDLNNNPIINITKTIDLFAKGFNTDKNLATVDEGLESFTLVLRKLIAVFRGIDKTPVDTTNLAPLLNFYTSFQTSITSINGGGQTFDATKILAQLTDFKSIAKEISNLAKSLPKDPINIDKLRSLQEVFAEILKFYTRFGDLVGQAADDSIATTTANILRGLGNLIQGIGTFFQSRASKSFLGSIGDLIIFRLALGQSITIIKSILHLIKDLDVSQVDAVGRFAKGMGSIFSGLGEFFKVVTSNKFFDFSITDFLKRIIQIRLGLIPLGQVLDRLRPLFKGATDGDVTAVAAFTKAVASIFTAISNLFELFARRENGASFGTIAKVWIALQATVRPAINLITSLKKIPTGINFAGLDTMFESLGKFVEQIALLSKTAANDLNTKALKTLFKQIGELLEFKGFKNLGKDSKNIQATAAVFTSISGLFEAINKIDGSSDLDKLSGLNNVDFGWIANLAKEFQKASGFLSSISSEDVAKLNTVYQSLSALSNIDKLKSGLGSNDLQKTIKSGIIGATIEIATFNTVVKGLLGLVSLFNPANIVSFFGTIASVASSVQQKLKDVFNDIRELGEGIKTFGQNIEDVAGISNIINSNVFSSTVEFDKLGSSLEVFGGLTKEQRKEAEDFASVIGKEYPLSANEALSATLDLIKAGQDLESTRFILPAAADLASLSDSGSIENATAFIIQSTAAFDQFSDTVAGSFDNAAVAVDIIAAAADSSTASVEGLSEGLANVGPVANTFGLTLEETVAALALFTDGGLSGAEAGTQLKSVLTNLTSDTARKELRRLGISVADAAGNIRPLNDILNDIQKKFTQTGTVITTVTKGLSGPDADRLKLAQNALAAAERQQFLIGNDLNATGLGKNADKKLEEAKTIAENATAIITEITGSEQETQRIVANIRRTELQNAESLKKIAGSYGQSGLAILLAQGEDGLKSFVEQMREVEPASVRARKALDNISGDFIQLQGSVETLGTKALLPLLEKFFRPFVQLARFFVDGILSMNDAVLEFISTALTLGASLASAVGAFAVVTGSLIQLGGAFGSVLLTLSSTFSLGILGAITGLTTGLGLLAVGFATLTPILAGVTFAFQTLYDIFANNRGGATDQLTNLAGNIVGALTDISDAVVKVVSTVGLLVSGTDIGSLDDLGKSIGGFFNSVSLQVTKFRTSGIGMTLSEIGGIFSGFYRTLSLEADQSAAEDIVLSSLEFDSENLGSAQRAQRRVKEARDAAIENYSQFLLNLSKNNKLLRSIIGDNATLEQLQNYFQQIFDISNRVRGGISNVFASFTTAFSGARNAFKDGSGFAKALKFFVEDTAKRLDNSLGDLASIVLDSISQLFDINFSDLSAVFNTQGFGAGVAKLIDNGIKAAKNFLVQNRDTIKGLLTFVFENLALGTVSVAKNFANLLGFEGIGSALDGVLNTLRMLFGGFVDTIFNLLEGQNFSDALLSAFGPGIQPFLDLGKSLSTSVGLIVDGFSLLFTTIFGNENAEVSSNSILDTITTITNSLTEFVDFVNKNFLSFFSKGDFTGFFLNTAKLIVDGLSSAFAYIIDFIANIDYAGLFRDFIAAITDAGKILLKAIGRFIDIPKLQEQFENFDLTSFVSNLIKQIPNLIRQIGPALERLGSFLFTHISSIFNFTQGDFLGGLLSEFNIPNFVRDIRGLLSRAVSSVLRFLSSEGGQVKTFVTKFFSGFFTGGLTLAKTLADLFGLEELSSVFDGIIKGIEGFIGNIITTISRILNGEDVGTVIADVFGGQFQIIADVVESLSTILLDGIKIIQDFITALFAPAPGGGDSPIAEAVKSVQDALSSVLDFIQNSFLAPLLTGDVVGAFSNLGSAVFNLLSGLASGLVSAINSLDLGSIFSTVGHTVVDAIVGTIGGLLSGFATLVGFDPSRFITNLDNILSSAIDAIGSGNVGQIFTSVVGSILSLLVNSISLGATAITTLIGFDASNFLDGLDMIINNAIASASAGGGGVFQLVVGTISGLLSTALGGIFDSLGALLKINPDNAFKTITDALQRFVETLTNIFTGNDDGLSIFDNVGAVIGKLVDAFNSLLDVFQRSGAESTIEKFINIVLDFVANLVASGIDTIGDFASGIDDLFQAFAQADSENLALLAAALGLVVAELTGISLISGLSTAVTSVVTLIRILSTGEAGAVFLTSNSLKLAQQALIGIANITGLSGAVESIRLMFFYLKQGEFALTASFALDKLRVAYTAFSGSIVAKAGALLVFVEFFRSIAQNISTFTDAVKALSEGDLGEAISLALGGIIKTFTDLGFNLLELLGIDTIFGQSREQFQHTADLLIVLMTNAANLVGNVFRLKILQPISDFLNITLPLAFAELQRLGAAAGAATGNEGAADQFTGFEQGRILADRSAEDKIDLASETFNPERALASIAVGGSGSINFFKAKAQQNAQLFYTDFAAALTDPANTEPADQQRILANFVRIADFGEILDTAALTAVQNSDFDILGSLLTQAAAQGVDTTALSKSIGDALVTSFNIFDPSSVDLTFDQLDFTIATFTSLGLDTVYLEQQRLQLQDQVDAFLSADEPPVSVDTTVPVDATLEPTVVNPDAAADAVPAVSGVTAETSVDVTVKPNFKKLEQSDLEQVAPTVQEAVQASTTGVAGDAPASEFDSSTLTDPQKVSEFNQLVTTLTDNVKTLATELNGLTSTQTLVTTTLSTIQNTITEFRDITVPMFGEVALAAGDLAKNVKLVSTALAEMLLAATVSFPVFSALALNSLYLITNQFTNLGISAETNLSKTISKVRELAIALTQAAGAATALSSTAIINAATSGIGGNAEGRASGGGTRPFSVYKVQRGDTKNPEIYEEDGQTYLLTGSKSGYVTNLSSSAMTGLYDGPRMTPSYAGASGGTNITIEMGGLTLSVNGTNLSDPKAVAAVVMPVVQKALDDNNKKLSKTLRDNQR